MKMPGIVLLVIALIASCDNKDENQIIQYQVAEGCYGGYFDYQNVSYWCSICFENGQYIEWPSGGVLLQKSMSCLTVGTYSKENNTMSFVLDSFKFKNFPEPCTTNMLLPGSYQITNTDKKDSLIFKRGTGNNQIIYYLKKYDSVD